LLRQVVRSATRSTLGIGASIWYRLGQLLLRLSRAGSTLVAVLIQLDLRVCLVLEGLDPLLIEDVPVVSHLVLPQLLELLLLVSHGLCPLLIDQLLLVALRSLLLPRLLMFLNLAQQVISLVALHLVPGKFFLLDQLLGNFLSSSLPHFVFCILILALFDFNRSDLAHMLTVDLVLAVQAILLAVQKPLLVRVKRVVNLVLTRNAIRFVKNRLAQTLVHSLESRFVEAFWLRLRETVKHVVLLALKLIQLRGFLRFYSLLNRWFFIKGLRLVLLYCLRWCVVSGKVLLRVVDRRRLLTG
jgi:hypothetical protein